MKLVIEKCEWLLLFVGVCSWLFFYSTAGAEELKIIKEGPWGMIVEFCAPELQVREKEVKGKVYQILTIAGTGLMDREGRPQLPVQGSLMAVPALAKINLEVMEQEVEVLEKVLVYPAPKKFLVTEGAESHLKEEFVIDQACYAQDHWIPEQVCHIDSDGYLRYQQVARLSIYPVQYNPALRRVRFYHKIKIKITFKDDSRKRIMGVDSLGNGSGGINWPICGEFKRLLKATLFNYSQARSFPVRRRKAVGRKAVVGVPPLKICLKQEGLYRILGKDLQDAGWDLVIPQQLKMYHQGREIPISLIGSGDGSFSPDDRIVFWGRPINSKFTGENIYWLYHEAGKKRIEEEEKSFSQPGQIVDHFIDHLHLEENHLYWQNLPGNMDKDRWFWRKLTAPSSADFSFSLDHPGGSERLNLQLVLQGKSSVSTTPDHHVLIYLNGTKLDDFFWDGQTEYHCRIKASSTLLREGNNVITIEAPGDTGALIDSIFLNWIELDYPRALVAEKHQLLFSACSDGVCDFQIKGFGATEQVSVFDITDPENIIKIKNISIEADTGFSRVKFTDSLNGVKRYAVLSVGAEKSPLSIEPGILGNLRSTDNGADYLIITPSDFLSAIQPLADYRKSQGLRVRVVEVNSIYDEFSHGIFDPQAIQDFLRYCFHNWAPPAPLYVLLVGDANIDYLDNYKTGRINYVPTHLYFTDELGETPNDNWFVCVNGDDALPDMFLGRISVRSPSEVQAVVDKIISYEQQGNQPWHQKALLVAGKEDTAFQSLTDGLAQRFLPSNFEVEKIYMNNYSQVESATEQIKQKISSGCLITLYCGHGNVDRWGSKIFTLSDVQGLENRDCPTFLISLTCLNGFFPHPKKDCCLAEEFLSVGQKGAMACLAPVSVSYPTEQKNLSEELFDLIFKQGDNLLGSCTTAARINVYVQHQASLDTVPNYVFFGDPATGLQGEYGLMEETKIGLSAGNNLLCWPGRKDWKASDLLEYLYNQGVKVKKILAPIHGVYQVAGWENGVFQGINFEIAPNRGYFLYAEGSIDLSFSFTPVYPRYTLGVGYNLVNFPADLDGYTLDSLFRELGALSVDRYEDNSGKWQKSYSFFGRPAGQRRRIEKNKGCVIWMSKTKNNWRPGLWEDKKN